jgi:hypothetical protein
MTRRGQDAIDANFQDVQLINLMLVSVFQTPTVSDKRAGTDDYRGDD